MEQSGTSDTSTTTNRISQNSQNVNTFDKKIDDERKSISKSADSKYLSAIENGDLETAQKMVDEAAKNAGYDTRAFHRTPYGRFYVFKGETSFVALTEKFARMYAEDKSFEQGLDADATICLYSV